MPRLSATDPTIHEDCEISDSRFGRYVEIGKGCRVHHSTIGDYSYCHRYADLASTTVGKFANIASFVRIGPTDHPMQQPSLHHFLYRSADYFEGVEPDNTFFEQRLSRRATIGHDTWIGHGAVVRPDISIGDGAVVAASAVVTHDVAPYTVVAGIPAKPIRARFAAPIAERLAALAWWNWDHDTLRARLPDFRTMPIETFLETYE